MEKSDSHDSTYPLIWEKKNIFKKKTLKSEDQEKGVFSVK